MRTTAGILSLLLTCTGLAAAQDVQSKPFNLVLQSADKSLDGVKLAACHSGAAIESLCLAGRDSGPSFYLNTTQGSTSPLSGYEPAGALIWNLPIGGGGVASEPMSFYTDPSTNVALPLFEPSYTRQYVAVERRTGRLAVIGYLDDSHTPPTADKPRALRNWYVCQSYYTGYQYHTLNWVLGNGSQKPQNPSCVKVEVQRKFV
ncbi:hypothetical protein JDV02_002116 [Purpureocillium takamizusanense]|uniref:DUF7907 domain-containing protein n=1 Tax=Purpureocillium takamizusanense TaxID=2060973 RepID=A0A9Q8Q836_9HYPO|nr:uncharacterized protein JDV02_002116 [Purpureocillium takamizusanense]UNI15594.1 hypothetical protein JDV02_002116 [Purpureocillium takamizusanense]